MKRVIIPTTIVLFLLPAFAYRQSSIYSKEGEARKVGMAHLHLGSIEVKVKGRGSIVAGKREEIRNNGKKIERILVQEGDIVNKGDLLAVLRDDELEMKKREAEIELVKNKAFLSEAGKGENAPDVKEAGRQLELSLMELERGKKEYTVSEELYKSGAISMQQYEDSKARLKKAGLQYDQANDSLSRITEKQRHEMEIARLNYEKAGKMVDKVTRELNELHIKAPIDGKIVSVNNESGRYRENEPLFVIADFNDLRVIAYISARDATRVVKGQKMQVMFDEYGRMFKETVDFVDVKVMREQFGADRATKVEVRGNLTGPFPDSLKLGTEIEVEIITEEAKGIPVIPIEAVLEESGRRFVYADVNGRATKKEVETGKVGMDMIEIKKGLAVGATVVTRGNLEVKDGERISWK